jgi:hypothetical protein
LDGGLDGDEREVGAAAGRDLRRLRPAAAEADLDVQPLFLEEAGLVGNVDARERNAGNGVCAAAPPDAAKSAIAARMNAGRRGTINCIMSCLL